MSELKVGDKVWIGPAEVIEIQDDLWIHTSVEPNGKEVVAFESQLIHDVPNLAAVARVLAAHPGIGDALQSGIEALHEESVNAEHWRGIRDYRITEPLEAMELLKLLAAALNGGTE